MRYLSVTYVLGAFWLFGCAHEQLAETPPTPAAVHAYRSVRVGAQPISAAGGVQFCADADGVEVVSMRSHGWSDWADKFRDRDVQRSVRDVIARDASLSGQQLTASVHEGEAVLGGTVRRDADAVQAASDALEVAGVVAVRLQTTSLDSPAPPRLVATRCE
jgi:osmotically-inducible protein OsmY